MRCTDGYGLELLSGATITNLANGTFNNYQSVTASDAYLWVHDSLIGSLSPTKTFAGVVFTQNGAGAPEYTVSQTVAGPTGYWDFLSATCTGWADCESSDNDTGSGNGTIQFGGVTIRIPRPSGSGQYPRFIDPG